MTSLILIGAFIVGVELLRLSVFLVDAVPKMITTVVYIERSYM